MAQIYKRNGGWSYRISYNDDQGKRHTINKQGFKLKSDAQDAARELEMKKSQVGLTDIETITFANYFVKWSETYKSDGLSPTTTNKYKNAGINIKEFFGNKLLKDIKRADYQQFINWYSENHAHNTVSRINGYIRASLIDALEEQIINRDFTQRVRIGGSTKKRNSHNFLDINDAKNLELISLETASMLNVSRAEIYFALLSGARFGEISALKWENIDFEKNQINIKSSFSFDRSVGLKKTKTESSTRIIDVPLKLIKFLRKFEIQQRKVFLRQGYDNKENFVFLTNRHEKVSPSAASKSLKKALNEIHSKNIVTFHGLRHTYASILIANDISIQYISKQLGHSNISITMNTYLHLLREKEKMESIKSMEILEVF